MKSSNLSTLNISDDLKREFTIDSKGKGITTQRGAARLLGITQPVISSPPVALIQKLAKAGIEGDKLQNGVTDTAFAIIALYIAFDSKSTNLQAVAVVETLTAIGARTLFQSIVGWEAKPEQKVLTPHSDIDRIDLMSHAVCKRYQGVEAPQDKLNLPGWLTVTEMLIELGENPDKDSGSLIHDMKFRFWINRQLADVYRAQYGEEAPVVNRSKGSGYCYPHSFNGLARLYRSNWILAQI